MVLVSISEKVCFEFGFDERRQCNASTSQHYVLSPFLSRMEPVRSLVSRSFMMFDRIRATSKLACVKELKLVDFLMAMKFLENLQSWWRMCMGTEWACL